MKTSNNNLTPEQIKEAERALWNIETRDADIQYDLFDPMKKLPQFKSHNDNILNPCPTSHSLGVGQWDKRIILINRRKL